MKRSHVVSAIAFTSASLLWAIDATTAAPATQPGQAEVDALVVQLSSDEARVREQAREALSDLGESVEPRLDAALKRIDIDPQTQSAIEGLLFRIQHARDTGPTRITLKRDNAPVGDVLDAIAKQAGVEFGGAGRAADLAARTLDVDFDRAPLWEALLDVCGRSGLSFRAVEGNRLVLLPVADNGAGPVPAAASGPFMVTVARVEVNVQKSIDFGDLRPMNIRTNNIASPPCRLYLFAWSEPRLRTIRWSIDAIDECVTDRGDALTPSGTTVINNRTGRVNVRNETQLILTGPTANATRIARMRLTARFVLQGTTDKLELPDVLTIKNAPFEVGSIRGVIKRVSALSDDQYSYEVSIQRDRTAAADWSLVTSMVAQYPCKLVDADGNALYARGGSSSMSGNAITMTNTVTRTGPGIVGGAKTGEPVKLVWEFPSNLEPIVVPLEFTDVPLP